HRPRRFRTVCHTQAIGCPLWRPRNIPGRSTRGHTRGVAPPAGRGGPMTAMIVDDEELARNLLREMLADHPEIEIIAECANGFEAVKAAAQRKPDLLFLDVQMPKLDGFEVLELIGGDLAVIFVTAHD